MQVPDPDPFGDDEEFPSWSQPHVDGAWGRTANPNTADGELQNIAAFGAGLSRLSGPRRRAAQLVVWAVLIGFVFTGLLAIFSHL